MPGSEIGAFSRTRARSTAASFGPRLLCRYSGCTITSSTLRNGSARAVRKVDEVIVHPEYRHSKRGPNDAAVDLALVRLTSPIYEPGITPFATDARPSTGDELGVISYTYVERTTPLWQHPCDVLAREGDVLVMNCEVEFGASGAPVFAVQGGAQPRLVSVISSKAAMGNQRVSVGTIVDRALRVLLSRAG